MHPNKSDFSSLIGACIAILATGLFAGCATPKPPQRVQQIDSDVYYGGVYLLAARVDEIPSNFPELYESISPPDAPIKQSMRSLINENRNSFGRINLKGLDGDLAPEDAIVMANTFLIEKYFTEAVEIQGDELRNVRAYLGGAFILQQFKRKPEGGFDISLLACYPYSLTCIDKVDRGSTPEDAGGLALSGSEMGLLSAKYRDVVLSVASNVAPVTGLGSKMQIRNILLADSASALAEDKFGGENGFRQWFATEIGAQLSRQIGISVIPFAEDTSSRKLAQMMESGEAYNISLPDPDYVVDVELKGFSVQKAKETPSEALWVYGAYGSFRIIEAGTGIVRWQKDLQSGVPKRVAKTQVDIDHSVAQFAALLGLIETLPKDLINDKKARPLIEDCLK